MRCAVLGCENSNENCENNCRFFPIPKDAVLAKKWLNFCQRPEEVNRKTSCICELHFVSEDFETNRRFEMGLTTKNATKLLPTAVPRKRNYSSSRRDLRRKRLEARDDPLEVPGIDEQAETIYSLAIDCQDDKMEQLEMAEMQCRACMQSNCEGAVDMSYVPSEDSKNLYDYFNECTQLHATTIDNLPKILCIKCADSLQAAFNFKQIACRSDEEFKKMSNMLKVEQNLIYDSADTCNVLQNLVECNNVPITELVPAQNSPQFELVVNEDNVGNIKEEFVYEKSNNDHSVCEDYGSSTHDEEEDVVVNGKGRHICDICSGKFNTKSQLNDHIFEEHKDKIICSACPKIFELPSELLLHNKLVHMTESPIFCPWCKFTKILLRDELTEHVQKAHKISYLKYFPRKKMRDPNLNDFECEICEKSFTSSYTLAEHFRKHKYNCPICSMTFQSESMYRRHVKQVHNKSIGDIKIMLFGSAFDEAQNTQLSMLKMIQFDEGIDQVEKSLHCTLCPREFTLDRSLQLHMKIIHNTPSEKDDEDQNSQNIITTSQTTKKVKKKETTAMVANNEDEFVKCKYCSKDILESKIEKHSANHIKAIKNKGRYICTFCPREFPYEANVKKHERNVHLKEEKKERRECPICQKLVEPCNFKRHMDTIHCTERKFICDICTDAFKTEVQLVMHRRLHVDRNIPCPMCPKKFANANYVKVHMRFHTGETPYECHLCDKRFKIKTHLTSHLQKHVGIKHKCNECGKEFNAKRQLKVHSYKHTQMPYKCNLCKYGCALLDVFKKHLLRVHGTTMTESEFCAMYKANTGRNRIVRTLEEIQMEEAQMN